MKSLYWVVTILFVAALVLSALLFREKAKLHTMQESRQEDQVRMDSLRAENKLLTTQLSYLIRYYDSTRRKIPQPQGIAYIGDSIMHTTGE